LELVRQRAFVAHALPIGSKSLASDQLTGRHLPSHAEWLGAEWKVDAKQTLNVLSNAATGEWLIVDHYALDERWETMLRSNFRNLMVIDDLADRHHDCDVLLDQNLGRQSTDYAPLVPDNCKVLVGPEYALLRPEFAALRDFSLKRRAAPQVKKMLVAMGGVDEADATGRVLESLQSCPLPKDCKVTVVMGPHAPWLKRVQLLATEMPWITEVHSNVTDMAHLMADSDIAIGAAGSTSWERCCLGLPSVIVVLANNQQPIADNLKRLGAAKIISAMCTDSEMRDALAAAFLDCSILRQMSTAGAGVVDGRGTARIVSRLLGMEDA
jgi:UDP-2,4-diacetamido-2,4,6-trideoxy-beta-L-altropyranose hydrolase